MAFIRIKTIRKNGKTYRYTYIQHNVRIGKKVKSFMRFLGVAGAEMIRGSEIRPPADYFRAPAETPGEKLQREFLKQTAKSEEARAESKSEPDNGT